MITLLFCHRSVWLLCLPSFRFLYPILSSVFHFSSVEAPLKPYYVWTFNENTGKWVNDVGNWMQKWELSDGTICLRNTPPESETSAEGDDMPWLVSKSKKSSKTRTESANTKAPLWSPPISEDAEMRCITMDYKIGGANSKLFSLAVLQQQDG